MGLRAGWSSLKGLGGLALLFSAVGCSSLGERLAPGREGAAPALVAFAAVLPQARGADVATLEVQPAYQLRNGSTVQLAARTIALSEARTQSVPVSVDLANCLADPARQETSSGDGCVVLLHLALAINGTVVDRQVVGPLQLVPGASANVAQPVSLFEIARIDLQREGGAALDTRPSLEIGTSLGLRAVVRDREGQVVTGRTVTWSSSQPTVATVDAAGAIRAVAAGSVRVTATLGSISQGVDVRVVRPAVEVTVRSAGGSGSGRVAAAAAAIDCQVTSGASAGSCIARFAADSTLDLVATPEAGSIFEGWVGACAGSRESVCRVSTVAGVTALARFTALRRVTVVAGFGDGRGRITGPQGLDCAIAPGSVSGRCEVLVPEGVPVTLVATPIASRSGGLPGSFAGWAGACVAESLTCSYTVGASDTPVRAGFRDARRLRLALSGDGEGRVTATGGIECRLQQGVESGSCAMEGGHGQVVVLRAEPVAGTSAQGWSGPCAVTSDTECRVTLDGDREVGVSFTRLRRLVIEAGGGDGRGRITGPAGLDCRVAGRTLTGTCVVSVPEREVELRAAPEGGQAFAGWTSACALQPTCRIALGSGETRAGARFFGAQQLRVDFAGVGGGQVTSPIGVACIRQGLGRTGSCEVAVAWGQRVTLTAAEDARSRFVRWSGACESTGRTCEVVLSEGRHAVAEFELRTVPLLLTTQGNGGGRVLVDGQTACDAALAAGPTVCRLDVPIDQRITIQALASQGSLVGGLAGDCTAAAACTLLMSAPRAVSARFDPVMYTLSAQLNGSGAGSVVVNGAVMCQLAAGQAATACTQQVAFGSQVAVSAVPASGSLLTAFSGACGPASPCVTRVSGPLPVVARFDAGVTLQVELTGPGEGVVTGDGGISCSLARGATTGSCSAVFAPDTYATIRATPAPGFVVAGWTGRCDGAPGPTCRIHMNEDLGVSVRFARAP